MDRKQTVASRSGGAAQKRKGRLLAAYAIVGVLAVIGVGALLALSSGSTSTDHGDSHINLASGSTNGVPPDNRPGIELATLYALNLRSAVSKAGCSLRLHLPDEGHRHIPSTVREPNYRTTPPTSGNHVDEQQADGAYRETPRPVAVVHSLEHGRLAIQYKPDLAQRAQLELIGLFEAVHGGTLLFPNPEMPHAVAATTWTNLLACRSYHGAITLAAIRAFGRATWGKFGGEAVGGIKPSAPTPQSR